MQKQASYKKDGGALYLVPTPIGNLEDMTFRAVRILKTAHLIASEDTRNTQKLLNHFEIVTPQISFHDHNYKERIPQLIERLNAGEMIAQVSDAGMPSVSDPGHELVVECIKLNIPVIALPGPTAGLTALIASGLPVEEFKFCGFLPRKKGDAERVLTTLKEERASLIFYESPFRVKNTITALQKVFGAKREAVICRELTKVYEEYLRGTLEELANYLSDNQLKGECVILVEGFTGKIISEEAVTLIKQGDLKEQVEFLMQTKKLSANVAIKQVAKANGLKKQVVYNQYHQL